MMIGLAKLLAREFGDLDPASISSICIRTAQPKYLVFAGDDTHPRYVVQFGDFASLSKTFDHLTELHLLMPASVPRPLLLSNKSDGLSMFVQEGLPGRPWFNLRTTLTTPQMWLTLRDRVIKVLAEFHDVVASRPAWQRDVAPWQILEATASQYKEVVGIQSAAFYSVVDAHIEILRPLGELSCFPQHGDFCINNLLLDRDATGIVDFEHFGVTHAPLHDEWLLVDSLMAFAPESCADLGDETWLMAMAQSRYAQGLGEEAFPALLLLFYLWWGVESANNPLRARKFAFYTACIEEFCRTHQADGRWQNACPWLLANAFT
jgi:hypothetical protein